MTKLQGSMQCSYLAVQRFWTEKSRCAPKTLCKNAANTVKINANTCINNSFTLHIQSCISKWHNEFELHIYNSNSTSFRKLIVPNLQYKSSMWINDAYKQHLSNYNKQKNMNIHGIIWIKLIWVKKNIEEIIIIATILDKQK